jgi:hypothetical protein
MGCSECLCEDTMSVVPKAVLGKAAATHQAADPSPCRTSAASHLHPRMLAGEPDSFSWPRSITANSLASESAIAVQRRAWPFAKVPANLKPSCWFRRADATYAALGDRTAGWPLAEADTYMPDVVCARKQLVKQRHGPKVAGALWTYGPDHVCSTPWRRTEPNKMTPVGFEPTPFRNGALSHCLRPLGQSVC